VLVRPSAVGGRAQPWQMAGCKIGDEGRPELFGRGGIEPLVSCVSFRNRPSQSKAINHRVSIGAKSGRPSLTRIAVESNDPAGRTRLNNSTPSCVSCWAPANDYPPIAASCVLEIDPSQVSSSEAPVVHRIETQPIPACVSTSS